MKYVNSFIPEDLVTHIVHIEAFFNMHGERGDKIAQNCEGDLWSFLEKNKNDASASEMLTSSLHYANEPSRNSGSEHNIHKYWLFHRNWGIKVYTALSG